MTAGLRRVGECVSGVLYRPQDAPQVKNGIFQFPEIIQHLALATPRALEIICQNAALTQALLRGQAGSLFDEGLTLESYYGRGDRVCVGVYFSHRIVKPPISLVAGQRVAVLDLTEKEDPVFQDTVISEAERYQQAKGIVYSLVPEGREIFFGITGITTSGLDKLSDTLYSALLARIVNKYGLESLAAIRVLQNAGMIERTERMPKGLMLTISSGTLEKEPGRAYPGGLRITSSPVSS